jgi:hypothetical protein
VRQIKSKRLEYFLLFASFGVFFYLIDCLLSRANYQELPWFETGIYAASPYGFPLAVFFVVMAFGYLLFGRDR